MGTDGPKRATTIRRSLLTNLLLLVVLVGGTIMAVSWIAARQTVEELSTLLIEPTARRTTAELDRFFGDVRTLTLIGRDWAQRNRLDPTDYKTLNDIFVPILEGHPQVSSMMVADSMGREYLLLRDALHPTVWHNRIVRADEWGKRVFNRKWDTSTGEVKEGFGELDYDPRRRIWYTEAMETTKDEPVFWTEPVIFFITKDPGITASTHLDRVVDHPDDKDVAETVVVAFDLLLLDISRFTSQQEISENGRTFVLAERDGESELQVVGLPRDEAYGNDTDLRDRLIYVPAESAVVDSDARLPKVDEIETPGVADAIDAWSTSGRPDDPFRFESNGQAWLAGFTPYSVGKNTFWIGVTLPERDLLGTVRGQRTMLLIVLVVILLVGLARATVLVRRFSMPIEALVRDTERIREGNLEPTEPVETTVSEFRRLAEAQEGMRQGLKARRKLEKIERDLDIAREIQRGLLPTLVPDTPGFLVEGWSQPADRTGGDFFDWMTMPGGKTLVKLADVTGHGIGPALIVAVCRAYMRASAMGEDVALSTAMQRVNELLCDDLPDGRFVTASVGVLDPLNAEMTLISAGQAPMFMYRAATGETERWDADDLPLGVAPDITFESPRHVHFEPGDTFVVTTDGFFEWPNPEGKMYGIRRLEAFVRAHAGEPPEKFIRALREDVLRYADGVRQPDDLTALVIQRSV